MKLADAVNGFILSKKADGVSAATERVYRYAFDKLARFCGDVDIGELSTQTVRQFFIWLREGYATPEGKPLSAGSMQQIHRTVKTFLAWCERELHTRHVDIPRKPSGESQVVQPFSESEVRALLKAAEYTTTDATTKRKSYSQRRPSAARNVAIVLTLLDTGLRLGELSRLDVGDYDEREGELVILPFGSSVKSRPRVVPLGKSARRALWKYTAERGEMGKDAPLFVTQDSKRMAVHWLASFFIRLGARAGVTHCHAHRLRHTFAVEFLRNGGNVFTLQKLLGHKTLAMTQKYVTLLQGDLADAHRRASPADKWRL